MTKVGSVPSFNLRSKSRDTHLLALYIAVATIFFYLVLLNQRNYQDVWILDGIAVPTALFICFSLVVGIFIHESRKLVIFVAFFLFAINIIPGLKYQLFSGCYDTPGHFKFTNEMVSSGSVPETEFYSKTYGYNPGMHILMSCVSLVSGISVNDVFKFVIPAVFSIIPLIMYFVTKGLLSYDLQRGTLLASGFPILVASVVWGTNLGMIPYLLLIGIFLRWIFSKKYKREFGLLFAVIGFGLIISHAVTSLFATLLLVGTPAILKFLDVTRTKISKSASRFSFSTSAMPSLLYLVLLITWWANIATFNLEKLVDFMRTVFTAGDLTAPIPTRFYQVPFVAQLQVLSVHHLGSFIMLALSLLGLFVFLRKSKRKEFSSESQALYLIITILLGICVLFLSFQFSFGFGTLQYNRFLAYAIPLCFPLAGLTLEQLDSFLKNVFPEVVRKFTFVMVLFVLVLACLIQFFPYQQLIPRANILSSSLPNNEFIEHVGRVNTPYQREMISFAERYSFYGRIASDATTRFQIYGFSNYSFFSRHIYFSPLDPDKNLKWDLFLLHTKKAAPFLEKVEYRTEERIDDLRLNAGNLIYDNGESFIISQ